MTESSVGVESSSKAAVPRLRRVLSLWDLIFYGIVAVTPSAPVTVFGLASVLSYGHCVDTILIAMIAMALTAISYGRMAILYPAAGSAYTFVGRGLHPHAGFMTGWSMLLCYLFIPLFCVIYGTLVLQRLFPQVPYVLSAVAFAGTMTFLNLRGIRTTAWTNRILLAFMGIVLVSYDVLAVRYLLINQGWGGVFSLEPFYNPKTFDFGALSGATAFAALTYIGVDSVATLAEDVKKPAHVLWATVLVCLFTGFFGGSLVYLGQRVWPDYQTYSNVETAFMDVTGVVGGTPLFQAMALLLVLANLGSGLTGQVGSARLLFGMGRDNVLPRRVFAYLHPKRNTPTYNIWLMGILAFIGSLFFKFEFAGEVINFGAFLTFATVNVAALRQFYLTPQVGRNRKLVIDAVAPAIGCLFCLWIVWNLPPVAKIAGVGWLLAGFTYDAIQTRGFRTRPVMIDFTDA
ncbi:MAG TPA: APC family permease [Terriglobia bacterium]|nr:APC family permease [Terriglobia bacterium]